MFASALMKRISFRIREWFQAEDEPVGLRIVMRIGKHKYTAMQGGVSKYSRTSYCGDTTHMTRSTHLQLQSPPKICCLTR